MNKFPAQAPEQQPQHAQFAKEIWEALGCKDQLTRQYIRVALVGVRVFDHKQQRYGTGNIAEGGFAGLITRMQDKVSRIKHLVGLGQNPDDEPIEDSVGDLSVYGNIGLMVRWGLWPGVSADAAKANAKIVMWTQAGDCCKRESPYSTHAPACPGASPEVAV